MPVESCEAGPSPPGQLQANGTGALPALIEGNILIPWALTTRTDPFGTVKWAAGKVSIDVTNAPWS